MLHKRTKIILIVLLIMGLSSASLFGCRMLSLMNTSDEPIDSTYDINIWAQSFEELQDQSYANTDGWAIVYYHRNSLTVAGEFRSADPAYQGNSYDDAYSSVLQDDPYIVIAHVRDATTGNPNIPDPHPFIFNYDDIDYAFAHNGTIYTTGIPEQLYDPFIPETDIDSEIYFMWIMQNIHENDGNIAEGIHDALNEMGNVNSDEARTFILTDGQDIYSYRDENDDCYYDHNLYYDYDGSLSPFHINSKMLMSDFGSLSNPFCQYLIDKDEIMYASSSTQNVLLDNFKTNNLIHKRSFHDGWNWSSFPITQSPSFNGPAFLDEMVDPGTITNVVCDQNYVDALYQNQGWLPDDFDLDNTHLFKLNFTESTPEIYDTNYIYVDGDMRDPDAPTIINVQGEDQGPVCAYWIGYTLLPTQNIQEAFGSHWGNVRYVFAEDWTYFDGTINRGGTPTWESLMKTEGKNMEFGKGYIVRFHNDAPSFTWHYPNTPIWSSSKREAEYFEPESKATYEVLEIASIEGTNNVIEIGAFQDGKCIGVTTVDSFPVQLLAYSDTYGGEITFQAISGNRGGVVNISQCTIYNENSGVYEQGNLLPRQNLFSSVKLNSTAIAMINENKIVALDQNIPNPFIYSTNISFRLSESRHIFVKVYNIKGELVANLIDGNYTSGKYDTSWNGKNINGNDVAAGLYFCKIETEGQSDSKKMLLIR